MQFMCLNDTLDMDSNANLTNNKQFQVNNFQSSDLSKAFFSGRYLMQCLKRHTTPYTQGFRIEYLLYSEAKSKHNFGVNFYKNYLTNRSS